MHGDDVPFSIAVPLPKSAETERIAREIDASWKAHRGDVVPPEIWRKVRAFKGSISGSAAAIRQATQNSVTNPRLFGDVVNKRHGIGKERALARLRRAFSGAAVTDGDDGTIEICWLEPRDGPVIARSLALDRGEEQSCTVLRFALLWASARYVVDAWYALLLECPDHSVGRLLQRAPQSNVREVLFAAGRAFAAADIDQVLQSIADQRTIFLPAGSGCFAAEGVMLRTPRGPRLHARARTWLASSMLQSDQRPIAPAATKDRAVLQTMHQLAQAGGIGYIDPRRGGFL